MKTVVVLCLLWLIVGVVSIGDSDFEGSGATGAVNVSSLPPTINGENTKLDTKDGDDSLKYTEDNLPKSSTFADPLQHSSKDNSTSSEGTTEGINSSSVSVFKTIISANGNDVNETTSSSHIDVSSHKETDTKPLNCNGYQKFPTQPQFANSSALTSVMRKCCPLGESFQLSSAVKPHAAMTCGPGEPFGKFQVQAISAQLYDGCIEDLEPEPPVQLRMAYGNPCPGEGGMVRFSLETNDRIFVIQNGSLLIINDEVVEYDVYNGYCLDVSRRDGNLTAYVCPSEIRIGRDIFKGQMVALALCLIFAIPLLLATAYFYVTIPSFNDIHGKALSLNCINFAVALLLESVFQHKTRGNGSTDDTIVLANYAEYFILATFFWLLVNCMNNCIHAWYFLPRGIQIKMAGEKRFFALYLAFAQLVPLAIILSHPPNEGTTTVKHYFFIPIMVVITLNLLSFAISFWGLNRVSAQMIDNYIQRGRLSNTGSEAAYAAMQQIPIVSRAALDRVKYMTRYTAMLFVVMAGVWSITIATYYSTKTIPILFDILFGLQGILIFIIFICLPRPFRTVSSWFKKNQYCGCHADYDEVDLRRHGAAYRNSRNGANGTEGAKEADALNNVEARS